MHYIFLAKDESIFCTILGAEPSSVHPQMVKTWKPPVINAFHLFSPAKLVWPLGMSNGEKTRKSCPGILGFSSLQKTMFFLNETNTKMALKRNLRTLSSRPFWKNDVFGGKSNLDDLNHFEKRRVWCGKQMVPISIIFKNDVFGVKSKWCRFGAKD